MELMVEVYMGQPGPYSGEGGGYESGGKGMDNYQSTGVYPFTSSSSPSHPSGPGHGGGTTGHPHSSGGRTRL